MGNRSQPAFLNFSITPVECSIMCPRRLADEYLAPLVERFHALDPNCRDDLSISKDDYIAMQVVGVGLEAGQRVLDLTSPLAMAGMCVLPLRSECILFIRTDQVSRSIFFITTYFSDYIIVPLHSKVQVIDALEKRGFRFEYSTDTFANNYHPHTSTDTNSFIPPIQTQPTPSTLSNLQSHTFNTLRHHQITPGVDRTLRLVHCAARYDTNAPSPLALLRSALTTCLLADNPRFLSLTLTATDQSASLLMEKRLIPRFSTDPTFTSPSFLSHSFPDHEPYQNKNPDNTISDPEPLLLHSLDEIIPIFLDLRTLPLEASGIVCGVASRLADATRVHKYDNDSPVSLFSLNSTTFPSTIDSGSSFELSSDSESETETESESDEDVVCLTSLYTEDESTASDTSTSTSGTPTSRVKTQTPSLAGSGDVDIGFLSTARAGIIIVGRKQLKEVVDALEAERFVY